ncbi:hypothetical protein HPB52_006066 [Rhipicephalus sanguineus]|uniref:Uncharacterized protein n=1 Tax=Rhipicephalus sanguineus TaxID=34632 RepID=A0A9D4Q4K4_RHISA|nr:hypothetical protein HPB52_006066 [Rhipicephalus sanguineus]
MAASDDDRSSINLSLRLRAGSSGSRDSYYMDLDRGIDSDIEMEPLSEKTAIELVRIGAPPHLPPAVVLPEITVDPGSTATSEQLESDSSADCASEPYLEGDYPGKNAKE